MAYRLEADEDLEGGLRRIAAEELEGATGQLIEGVEGDPVTAVHEARKHLKKERSVLRLLRAGLDRDAYRAEMTVFRDAGRRLSATRDADVALKTFDDLRDRFTGRAPKRAIDGVRRSLAGAQHEQRRRGLSKTARRQIVRDLRAARRRLDERDGLKGDGWKVASRGITRAYERGRDALARVRARPEDVEAMHEWRKRVKDLWYHQRVLAPLWDGQLGATAHETHRLSELLGDANDLRNLRAALAEDPVAEPLVGVADQRRDELLAEAIALGRRVYAERPKAYLRRLDAYRRVWEAEKAERAAPAANVPD